MQRQCYPIRTQEIGMGYLSDYLLYMNNKLLCDHVAMMQSYISVAHFKVPRSSNDEWHIW